MRFLADEGFDFAIVRRLRAEGHDVLAICEHAPGVSDDEVAALARREDRVLLTEDKDFGQLVYAGDRARQSVIFLRVPFGARAWAAEAVANLAAERGAQLAGRFVVVQPGRIRIGG